MSQADPPPQGIPPRRRDPSQPAGRDRSAGLIIGVVAGGLFLLVVCGAALLLPAVQQAREAARRSQCKNNLKQLALGGYNFEETVQQIPGSAMPIDEVLGTSQVAGSEPVSWRVAILPFVDQPQLLQTYDESQPWDGPANASFASSPTPQVYVCPTSELPVGQTPYVYAVGEGTLWNGPPPYQIADITDGTSNTIWIGERAHDPVIWVATEDSGSDWEPRISGPAPAGNPVFSSQHPRGANASMMDGSVLFLSETIDPVTLQAMLTHNSGEVVSSF